MGLWINPLYPCYSGAAPLVFTVTKMSLNPQIYLRFRTKCGDVREKIIKKFVLLSLSLSLSLSLVKYKGVSRFSYQCETASIDIYIYILETYSRWKLQNVCHVNNLFSLNTSPSSAIEGVVASLAIIIIIILAL